MKTTFSLIFLLAYAMMLQISWAQNNSTAPKYTPKNLVRDYLDTLVYKDIKPTKQGLSEGETTDYILANTTCFDVSDDKSASIKIGGNFVMCFKGMMQKGKKEGVFKAYFILEKTQNDMILNMEQSYKANKRHGKWTIYDLSGNIISVHYFKNDSLDGVYTDYWFNGEKSNESNFKNGKLHGKQTAYSSKGKPSKEVSYKDGVLDGIGKMYYPNGSIMETQEFKNGQRHGARKYYYENGQLWVEIILKGEKYWEVVANFDEKGNKRNAGTLKKGNGTIIYYNENGTVREVLNYQNGIETK